MPTVPTLAVNKTLIYDGNSLGIIGVDTTDFEVNNFVFLQATGERPLRLVVGAITDATHMTLLSERCTPINLAKYTVLKGATVGKIKA